MDSTEVEQVERVEMDEFLEDTARHLRASWGRGASLVLTIDGEPQVKVDTIEDLEAVYARLLEFRHSRR